MTRTAHIVGAGIAGLATAVALAGRGWAVRVYERAPGLRASGGGIGVTPNGMRALAAIGVADAVRARSVVQAHGGVRAPGGRWIARTGLRFVEERYGEPIRALLRLDLVRALADALPPGTVHYGQEACLAGSGGPTTPATLVVGGATVESDLVVGADGIRSALRRALHPGHPGLVDTGSAAWRCVVPADGLDVVAAETWGAGQRLSILPLPEGRAHFSALAKMPPHRAAGGHERLTGLFGRWHDPIPHLLERASRAELHFDRIEDAARPLDGFAHGRVVLVGDAAHPMTPNVGAAGLALEDAVELAQATAGARSWDALRAGLAAYDASRRARTTRLRAMSRWMGRVAGLSAPVAVAARNTGVWLGGLLPEAVSRRSMDAMVGWSVPPPR
ncbi:FAD-dependent oxidoreductase [Actinokineospora sp. UTMC 2448]|uniref:FAD-dependent oxidoreductase n=1 Tax=Actinokineospora sp. UTMC 2448 TaxID=2268449 RepID=UPI002164DEE3|nr:FAD-dependent oxidoreductase [Actinokineospora sp. UTMC 2448]UVS79243.1 FAD-dependent urate hydroxylase [Actinokineospora sp. UTMC 2448]